MENVLKMISSKLASENKIIKIPAGSLLSRINQNTVLNTGNFEGIDVLIAKTLSNEISIIRNEIFPIIKEYGSFVQEGINKIKSTNPVEKNTIITFELPLFVEEMINREIIRKRDVVSLPKKVVILNRLAPNQIRELLIYGGGMLEETITAAMKLVSDEVLTNIWDTYLTNISHTNPVYSNMGNKNYGGIIGLDLFVLSILLKNLKNKNIFNVPMNDYSDSINSLETLVDGKIFSIKNMIDMVGRGATIIRNVTDDGEVIVYKNNYDKFLNAEGTPEAILGASVSNKAITILSTKEEIETAERAWDKYVNDAVIKQNLSMFQQYRLLYSLGMTHILNDFINEDTKSRIPVEVIENINNIMTTFINSKKIEDLSNIPDMVEHAVTKILFDHTNASEFIGYMKHYSRLNPDITPQEAAAYASSDITIDYILTLIEV